METEPTMYGSVLTEEYLTAPNGGMTNRIVGNITVVSSQEALGFEAVTERNANWLVVVSDPGTGEVVYIPGCKIYAVHRHGKGAHEGAPHQWRVGS